VHKYHGPKRESDPLKLLDFDVIFTTYTTMAAEFRNCSNVLHSINWFRIVLDEGRFVGQLAPIQSPKYPGYSSEN
jgi:SWI/SNF-related matrix-associated actin-dependent regulator of chromatin subfamily A3